MFLQEIADESSALFEQSFDRFTFILFELDRSLQLSLCHRSKVFHVNSTKTFVSEFVARKGT